MVTAGGESCCVDTEEATEGELRELVLERSKGACESSAFISSFCF